MGTLFSVGVFACAAGGGAEGGIWPRAERGGEKTPSARSARDAARERAADGACLA
jgi:hypothetical protein